MNASAPLSDAAPPREDADSRLLIVAVLLLAAGTVGAAWLGYLPLAAAAVVGCCGLFIGLRWPLLPLFAFVALIPLEELIVIEGVGTLSRGVAALFAVSYLISRRAAMRLDGLPIWAWLYVGWAVASTAWASDIGVALPQLFTLVQLFVVAVLIADVVITRPSLVAPLMWTYTAAAIVAAALAVSAVSATTLSGGERAASFAGQDAAQFAALLLPAFVFCLYQLSLGVNLPVSVLGAVLTGAGLILSGTRGAWVGALVVIVAFVMPRLTRTRRLVALGATAVIVVAAVQVPAVADFVVSRWEQTLTDRGAGRADIWLVGFTIVEDHPIAGVGFANFPVAFTADRVREVPVEEVTGVGRGPHNIVIGTLGELGVMGLALLAMFVIPLIVRRGWGPNAVGVQAMLASVAVAALFLDLFTRKGVWFLLAVAGGLAVLRRLEARRTADPYRGGPALVDGPAPSAGTITRS